MCASGPIRRARAANESGLCPIEECLDQRLVAVEGRGDREVHTGVPDPNVFDESRQVALHMESQGEEIGYHYDPLNAVVGEALDCASEVGLAEFQKRGFHLFEGASATRQGCGHRAHRLVGRFDAGAVCEDDDSGGHAPWM